MKAGFSNALRSTFMFSKRGGRDTDVQFIVQKKGLLHILAANTTALLCSPSDSPTLHKYSGSNATRWGMAVIAHCPSHAREDGKERGLTGHCPSNGLGLGRDPRWCYCLSQLRAQANDGFHQRTPVTKGIPRTHNLEPNLRVRRWQQVICHSVIQIWIRSPKHTSILGALISLHPSLQHFHSFSKISKCSALMLWHIALQTVNISKTVWSISKLSEKFNVNSTGQGSSTVTLFWSTSRINNSAVNIY